MLRVWHAVAPLVRRIVILFIIVIISIIILVLLVLGVFDDEVGCLGRLGTDIFFEFIPKPARSDAKKCEHVQTRNQNVRRGESKSKDGNQDTYQLETFNCR